MKPLAVNEAEVGMEVKLTHPDPGYGTGLSNPTVGTKYECEGEIVGIANSGSIQVRWSNGTSNSYKDGELSLAGPCIDIWREVG